MARQHSNAVSARLAAAQEQLHQRREQCRQERIAQRLPVYTDTHGRSTLPHSTINTASQPGGDYVSGWESHALAHAMRVSDERQKAQAEAQAAMSLCWLPQLPADARSTCGNPSLHASSVRQTEDTTITLHPDIAIAMLQGDLSSPGRVWLLLRHLDDEGCGWVTVNRTRQALTEKQSPLRICGWRQLRNLLSEGDHIFWKRDDVPASQGRIWLQSAAKVAAALGVQRLGIRPVALPLSTLLQGIGAVRAHFYASYHSGRDSRNPIARRKLTEITGVGRRSQQNYEKKAGVKRHHNWAVGEQYSRLEAQRRSWQHGHALFQLKDYQGKSGPTGKSYLAWQLPNSFAGPHAPQTNTRRKRINRRLVDLFNQGITGNSREAVERNHPPAQGARLTTRFYEHGQAAARAYNRGATNDLYWRAAVSYRDCQVWHVLPGQGAPKK